FSPAYDGRSLHTLSIRGRGPEVLNKLLDYDLDRIFLLNPLQREDVLVNSVYGDGLQALARLAERRGDEPLRSWAATRAQRVLDRLLERCYDERRGLFFNLDGTH